MDGKGSSVSRKKQVFGKKPFGAAVLVLLLVLLGGCGGLNSLFPSGEKTGMDSSHDLRNTYSGYEDSWGQRNDWNSSVVDISTLNTGTVNTEVSENAREKMTVIQGGGQDIITVMVYMCGADLESRSGLGTADLQEMIAAEIGDNINLLVYTGGCSDWQNNVVSSRTNQVFQVKNNGLIPLIADVGSKSMTDPKTLSQYIRWAKKYFPADRYDLILWDHGGGSMGGYGYDENFASGGSMTLDGIRKALKAGECNFDFVGFDASLMATLETAWMVQPFADYMIASEEREPGSGWYYTEWLSALSRNPSMSTLEIGKYIADDYINVCNAKAPGQSATLSVLDLGELYGTVPDKFREFAVSAGEMMNDGGFGQVSNARNRTREFAKDMGRDQVDLIHLAENLDTAESIALAEALKDTVKYNRTSPGMRNAYGISVYFPYTNMDAVNDMVNTYHTIKFTAAYTECIERFASMQTAGQIIAGGKDGQVSSLVGSLVSGSSYSSKAVLSDEETVGELLDGISDEKNIVKAGLNGENAGFLNEAILKENEKYLTENRFDASALVWSEKADETVLKLEKSQWDLIQNMELNVFLDDGEGYLDLGLDAIYEFDEDGDMKGFYDGTWIGLNGQIVAYYMISAEGTESDYEILGRVPAMLNGERADLILRFSDENPQGEVLGASICYTEGETQTVSKGLISLKEGDTLDFLCDYYTYDKKFRENDKLGEQMTVRGEVKVESIYMYDLDYVAAYRLTDIYNQHYWTPALDSEVAIW